MKKKILIFMLALLVAFQIMPTQNIKAASGSSSSSVSTSSPVLGNKVTFTIRLKCSTGVGGAVINVSYNQNYLTYDSFSGGGKGTFNASTNKIVVDGSEATSVSFTLTFTTVRLGSTTLQAAISGFIDYNGDDVTGFSENLSRSIEIVSKTNNNTEKTTTLSKDASLSSLSIEGISLEEEFDGSKTEYTAYATKGTTTVNVAAKTSSSKAKVGQIASDVVEGWNKIDVTVTAESGDKKTYSINLYVEETPTVYFNEGKLGVVKNLDKVEKIEGYEEKTVVMNNEEVTVFTHGNLNAIYLVNENGEKAYYLYDPSTNSITDLYEPIIMNGQTYFRTAVDYAEFAAMNDLFEPVKVSLNGTLVDGWKYKYANMEKYRIVYIMDENGNKQLYSYELTEDTMQKFTLPVADENLKGTGIDYQQYFVYGGYAAGAVGILCLLFTSIVIAKRRAKVKASSK